jgi:hypothetical protein
MRAKSNSTIVEWNLYSLVGGDDRIEKQQREKQSSLPMNAGSCTETTRNSHAEIWRRLPNNCYKQKKFHHREKSNDGVCYLGAG